MQQNHLHHTFRPPAPSSRTSREQQLVCFASFTPFIGKFIQLVHFKTSIADCYLNDVGKPIFHAHSNTYFGSWMRDAYPQNGKVWMLLLQVTMLSEFPFIQQWISFKGYDKTLDDKTFSRWYGRGVFRWKWHATATRSRHVSVFPFFEVTKNFQLSNIIANNCLVN